ncbi:type II toxin-antitoxin system VapC family toxin [Fimbriiglobus ruber]|uniref:type II toxin-antitoxin system VapC family toxin n=1 Tax=Fimbriiglobus ruber TaxID=1908690 RepID=UPI000B4B05E1|nr:PIN domain-containing protein [Fimbriiglobus ruber]
MSDVVADTHSIVWFLFDTPRLSPAADAALTAAISSGRRYISAITLVELNYLTGKASFPYPGILRHLLSLIADTGEPVDVLPVTLEIARALDQVPRSEVPAMPDRIIAATAVAHKLPLVSTDSDIQGSASLKALVPVIW